MPKKRKSVAPPQAMRAHAVWVDFEDERNPDLGEQAAFFSPLPDGRVTLQWPMLLRQSLLPCWSEGQYGQPFDSKKNLDEAVREVFDNRKLTTSPVLLGPGEFYPRVWRPCGPDMHELYRKEFFDSRTTLLMLLARLRQIFEVVEPDPRHARVFGHEIRHLLLLACMEVESAWAVVLSANHYSANGYFTRKHYRQLHDLMRLDLYSVRLASYPAWPEIRPFAGWGSSGSLPWYDAYNATKHNREKALDRATVENAVMAVAATFVMLNAQFGVPAFVAPSAYETIPDLRVEASWPDDRNLCYMPATRAFPWTAVDAPLAPV